jgi:IS5 family transposase
VASESILRLALVQQIEELSFREVIVRTDDSAMLRFFCHFYDDRMPSHSTYATLVNLIRPETWKKLNELLVRFAREKRGFRGKQLRVDTTAVETDVHFPTDSSLLWDGVRVLSRLIKQARRLDAELVGQGRLRIKNARRLAQQIARGGKNQHKARQRSWYRDLIAATERVVAWAEEIVRKIRAGAVGVKDPLKGLALQGVAEAMEVYLPRVGQCIWQARRRVLEEQPVPNAEKLFSIFEPHTELLMRGKAGKKLEFGHMVELCQIEGGLITSYTVHAQRPAEAPLLAPAVAWHEKVFGRVPQRCAGDKGFYSAAAVAAVSAQGVAEVCVPKKGRRNAAEEQREKSRWFKAGQAFRAGIEGTISVLKRAYGLTRCLREGWRRFQSWVGAGVWAHNLVLLART